jgi:hypothetical protein
MGVISHKNPPYLWKQSLDERDLCLLNPSDQAKYRYILALKDNSLFNNFKVQDIHFLIFRGHLLHFAIPDLGLKDQTFLISSITMMRSFAKINPKVLGVITGILRAIDFDRIVLANFLGLTHCEYPPLTTEEWVEVLQVVKIHLQGYTVKWSVIYNDSLLEALRITGKDQVIVETATAEISPDTHTKIFERYRKRFKNSIQKALDSSLITVETIRCPQGSTVLSDEDVTRIVTSYHQLYNVKYNKGNALTFNESYVRQMVGHYFDLLVIRNKAGQLVGGMFFNFRFYQYYRINWVFYDQIFAGEFKAGGASLYTVIMFTSILDIIGQMAAKTQSVPLNISNGVLDYKLMNFYANIYHEKLVYDFTGERSPLRRLAYQGFKKVLALIPRDTSKNSKSYGSKLQT